MSRGEGIQDTVTSECNEINKDAGHTTRKNKFYKALGYGAAVGCVGLFVNYEVSSVSESSRLYDLSYSAVQKEIAKDGFNANNVLWSTGEQYEMSLKLGNCELTVDASAVPDKDGVPTDMKDYSFLRNNATFTFQNMDELLSTSLLGPDPCKTLLMSSDPANAQVR